MWQWDNYSLQINVKTPCKSYKIRPSHHSSKKKNCHVHHYCFSHSQDIITSIYYPLSNEERMTTLVSYNGNQHHIAVHMSGKDDIAIQEVKW